MKLSNKMICIGCISIVALSILFIATLWTNSSVTKSADMSELRGQQLKLIEEMRFVQIELVLAAMDSIIDKDKGSISKERMSLINKRSQMLTEGLAKISAAADTGEEEKLAQGMVANVDNLIRVIQVDLVRVIEESGRSGQEALQDFIQIDDTIDKYGDALNDQLAQFSSSIQGEANEASATLRSVLKSTRITSIVTFIVALLLLVTALTLITLSITKPIATTVMGLFGGAEQVSNSASQISSSSQTLAEGASEQAAAIEETSASMEEMASMTKQNADNATQADSLMKTALDVIKTADTSMNKMSSSMEEISKASEETSKIVKTIDEIAFQTNLLALNAAVEAARAGEAGAGFAVVADEVRNLAMRAAEAAKNTSNLIEETVQRVTKGKGIVVKANEAFREVAESSTKVGTLVDEIASASKEQAQGFGQINAAIVQMDSVTQQNSATAEESAAASEELNAQAETMMDMIRDLKNILDGDVRKPSKSSSSIINNTVKPRPTPKAPLLEDPKRQALDRQVKSSKSDPEKIIPMDDDDDFEDF